MGELIRIGAPEGTPGLHATIDTTGAWVAGLSLDDEVPILHPRFVNEEGKYRGGMHVCSPYFGPDRNLSQHGYARDEEWEVTERHSGLVGLTNYQTTTSGYTCLRNRLSYVVAGNTFLAILRLTNEHASWGMSVAPGFHPYFSGSGSVSNEPIFKEPDDETIARGASRSVIHLASGLDVIMEAQGMQGIVEWSDKPEEYHCVEPVDSVQVEQDGRLKRSNLPPRGGRTYIFSLNIKTEAEV